MQEPSRSGSPLLIFTDVDGTLVNHTTYDFAPVLPTVERCVRREIPVVLCSSKTVEELEVLQRRLGLVAPLIAENGGIVIFPAEGEADREEVLLGKSVEVLQDVFSRMREAFGLEARSIREMSVEEVAGATGLPLEQAASARLRRASLPFLLGGDEAPPAGLAEWVRRHGCRLTRGGRCWHLLGEVDKGDAVRFVADRYRRRWNRELRTLGLGDSENDLEMLRAVDLPVRIPNPAGKAPLGTQLPWAVEVDRPAPEGWRRAVESLLDREGVPS